MLHPLHLRKPAPPRGAHNRRELEMIVEQAEGTYLLHLSLEELLDIRDALAFRTHDGSEYRMKHQIPAHLANMEKMHKTLSWWIKEGRGEQRRDDVGETSTDA